MTKFTDGPWYVVDDAIYRRPKSDLYEHGGTVGGDKPLALVRKGWYGENESGYPVEANANLIAASPDMYDALYYIVEELMCGDHTSAEQMARFAGLNALKKARGES